MIFFEQRNLKKKFERKDPKFKKKKLKFIFLNSFSVLIF